MTPKKPIKLSAAELYDEVRSLERREAVRVLGGGRFAWAKSLRAKDPSTPVTRKAWLAAVDAQIALQIQAELERRGVIVS